MPAYNVTIHWVEGTADETLQAGKAAVVRCRAHGSYPPPDLAWWLDHRHLTQHSNQVGFWLVRSQPGIFGGHKK